MALVGKVLGPWTQGYHLFGTENLLIGDVNNPDTLYGNKLEQVDREVAHALEAGVAVIGPECAVPLNMNSAALRRITEAARANG